MDSGTRQDSNGTDSIDEKGSGNIKCPGSTTNPNQGDRFIVSTLKRSAISSQTIEICPDRIQRKGDVPVNVIRDQTSCQLRRRRRRMVEIIMIRMKGMQERVACLVRVGQ